MMDIHSNYHPRELYYYFQLSEKWRKFIDKGYDWMDEETKETAEFFIYKNWCYYLGDFMRIEHHPDKEFSKWHGYSCDTFFSGILVKYLEDDYTHIIVATYYSH